MMQIKRVGHKDVLEVRQSVLWPKESIDFVRLDKDEKGFHYGLFVDNSLVSVISAFVENDEAQFRKFATLEEYQGKGYGSKLFTYMLEELEEASVHRIWCDARVDAIEFYERFGFSMSSGDIFFKKDIQYVQMERHYMV